MIYWDRLQPGDQWDQFMWEQLLTGELYPHGLDIRQLDTETDARGVILMIPGRYWHDKIDQVNTLIEGLEWVLAIRTGDEEDLFHWQDVAHDNITWWVQTPRQLGGGNRYRPIPLGFPPHFSNIAVDSDKNLDMFLSAQNNHERRLDCFTTLGLNGVGARDGTQEKPSSWIEATAGFTGGMPPENYVQMATSAKVMPCPSGPHTPDTFRVYEALEAHAVPIADEVCPAYNSISYWHNLFLPHPPFPVLQSYESLVGYCQDALKGWPANANRIAAWWMQKKREYAHNLVADLKELGAI